MITCVCVCVYSFTVEASSVCKMSWTYLRVRINDVVLWVLTARLRLGLSHPWAHTFRQNFQDILNTIYSYGDDIETTIHYLHHCPNYLDERRILLHNLESIGENIHDKNDFQISELLLFDVSSNNDALNTCILNATIQNILAPKRFHVPLTNSWVVWKIHIFEYIC